MPRGSHLNGIHGIAGQIVEDTVAAAFGLRHLLFGISPFDPITLGTSIAVVVALTVAARRTRSPLRQAGADGFSQRAR